MPLASAGSVISSSAQLGANVVTNNAMADNAVGNAEMLDNAVGSAEVTNDSLVNADINSAAAIADTKLGTIATAGKVSGAALTLLPNIPAGAGVIPAANLPGISAKSGTGSRSAGTGPGTDQITHGLGTTPKFIRISAIASDGTVGGGVTLDMSVGSWTTGAGVCLHWYKGNSTQGKGGTNATIIELKDNAGGGSFITASIANVGATTFDISFSALTGTGVVCYYMWEVIG